MLGVAPLNSLFPGPGLPGFASGLGFLFAPSARVGGGADRLLRAGQLFAACRCSGRDAFAIRGLQVGGQATSPNTNMATKASMLTMKAAERASGTPA